MARKRSRSRARNGGKAPSFLRRLLRVALFFAVLGVVAAGGALAWLWPRCSGAECPDVESLRDYTPPQASRVYDARGALVAHLAPERRIVLPIERIPAHVSGAFLAVEDKRFYQHEGVDYRRFAGALARNVQARRWDQGFSTVTMQLARNVFPEHLTRAKTLRRKLWEVMIARKIEDAFSKDQILEMYLNQIYLGQGLYGVEAAARGYFNKPVAELDNAEAALLAALPKSPAYYDPRRHPEAALRRRDLVLGLMASSGVITPDESADGRAQPLGLAPPPETKGRAPYLVAAVRRELRERFGPDAETAGLRVFTALDPELQASAERALADQLRAVEAGEFGRFRHPRCATGPVEDAGACLQGMFVALDPQTGDVRALVGGRDFALSQFDRATQARRQAGSAFKPIVFAAALADGIPVTTPLVGPGVARADSALGSYRPADHVSDTLTLDLRGSLRTSSNTAAVVLGQRVGAPRVIQAARDLGLTTPINPYPSTFLGAAEVVPIELVAAYAAFANGGMAVRPRLIQRVESFDGRVLWENRPERRVAMSPGVAFLTTSLMREVVDRGTGSGVRRAGLPYAVPAAGKTGTTNEAADVWFVGATPDLVAGVWLGFDRPKRILAGASGGGLAAPIWGRVMAKHYERNAPPAPWSPPSDLRAAHIDRESGLLATPECPGDQVVTEYFLPGTEPTEYCPAHPEDYGSWFTRTLKGIGDWLGGGGGEEQERRRSGRDEEHGGERGRRDPWDSRP